MSTRCAHCGFQNPPEMRFCGNCGTRLQIAPGTGQLGDPEPIPQQLGIMIGADLAQRLQQAGLEAAGQRRNVTVLFADLTGSTALSERMDTEDLFDLIQKYIQLLINAVYKYEGIVDKLTGDGLMALFGAPIALENNAERAIRAALDMQDDIHKLAQSMKAQLGTELSMRVGLHSGSVIVGGVGSNMLMDYTAIGDTVNLAHRIEEAAPPGSILISEVVYRQIRAVFDCQQISVLNPKGITHPVIAFRVLGVKSQPGRLRGVEGLNAPMIGRDHELKTLHQALNLLLTEKTGQFALITGEAGLGKSRLTSEFKTTLDFEQVLLLEGQSLAYRRTISYWLILDILYNYLRLPRDAPPELTAERLRVQIYQVLGSQAEELLPYLEHLFGLPYSDPAAGERLSYLDAGQLRQQIFLAVRDVLLVEAYHKPLLIILEDLHWADEASLELIRFLVESLSQTPIFLLGITRQVLEGPLERTVTLAEKLLGDGFHPITLQQLPQADSETLLLRLLSLTEFPPSLRQEIIRRAAGIPFYLEEILRMLIDQGVIHHAGDRWQVTGEIEIENLGVPDTLQELILARFDRLDAGQRRLLQVASVIGISFAMPVLNEVLDVSSAAVTQATLASVVERDFVHPSPGEALGEGAGQYTFRHILMSDAIYHTLLRKERRKLHGQVGKAIESLYADRLDSQVELLAYHFRWSDYPDRALHYLLQAGKRAAQNNANEQARMNFAAAVEFLDRIAHTSEQALQAHLGFGDTLAFEGDYTEAHRHYQLALNALNSERQPFYTEKSLLYRRIAKIFERRGNYEKAVENLANAETSLNHAAEPLPGERAQIWNDLGWIYFRSGDLPAAKDHLERALDLVKDSPMYDVKAAIDNRLAAISYNQGDWDTATSYLKESITLRESIRDLAGLAASLSNLGYLDIEMGRFDEALDNLTRSYEIRVRLGHTEGIAVALTNLGWLRTQRGELAEARRALDEALELTQQVDYVLLTNQVKKNLGELSIVTQDWQNAERILAEIVGPLQELKALDQLLDTYRLLGETALATDDLAQARHWSDKAHQFLENLTNEEELSAVQRGEFRRFNSLLALREGQWQLARQLLQESQEIFKPLRSHFYQGKVVYQFGVLHEALEDWQSAENYYEEAARIFKNIGSRLEEQRALAAGNRCRAR